MERSKFSFLLLKIIFFKLDKIKKLNKSKKIAPKIIDPKKDLKW